MRATSAEPADSWSDTHELELTSEPLAVVPTGDEAQEGVLHTAQDQVLPLPTVP
jgi:hypothetical protein